MKCAALISCLAFVTLEDILACRSQRGTGVTNNINYGSVPLKPFPSTCIDVHLPSICLWKKKTKLSGSAGNLTKCKYYKKGWGGKCDAWIIKARHLSGTCEYLHAQTMQASKEIQIENVEVVFLPGNDLFVKWSGMWPCKLFARHTKQVGIQASCPRTL